MVRSLIGLFAFRSNPVSKEYQHRSRNGSLIDGEFEKEQYKTPVTLKCAKDSFSRKGRKELHFFEKDFYFFSRKDS